MRIRNDERFRNRFHDLEKQPGESVGNWAERLLVAVINQTGNAKAERTVKGGSEDNYGVDIWVKIEGFEELIPIDLTLNTDPEVIEEKHRNARETGFVVFEAAPAGISIRDLKLAARGGKSFREKVLEALDGTINRWYQALETEGKLFITRKELAERITADEIYHRQQEQQRTKDPRRPPTSRGAKKRYKREKRARHAATAAAAAAT
jgi:hypothetical protein